MNMTKEQLEQLRDLAGKAGSLIDSLDSTGVSNIYAATTVAGSDSFILSANREGLIYFASILLSLASEASDQQHYHYDANTVLSKCDMPLILKYEAAPWESHEGGR
jgi:hypothetical protein